MQEMRSTYHYKPYLNEEFKALDRAIKASNEDDIPDAIQKFLADSKNAINTEFTSKSGKKYNLLSMAVLNAKPKLVLYLLQRGAKSLSLPMALFMYRSTGDVTYHGGVSKQKRMLDIIQLLIHSHMTELDAVIAHREFQMIYPTFNGPGNEPPIRSLIFALKDWRRVSSVGNAVAVAKSYSALGNHELAKYYILEAAKLGDTSVACDYAVKNLRGQEKALEFIDFFERLSYEWKEERGREYIISALTRRANMGSLAKQKVIYSADVNFAAKLALIRIRGECKAQLSKESKELHKVITSAKLSLPLPVGKSAYPQLAKQADSLALDWAVSIFKKEEKEGEYPDFLTVAQQESKELSTPIANTCPVMLRWIMRCIQFAKEGSSIALQILQYYAHTKALAAEKLLALQALATGDLPITSQLKALYLEQCRPHKDFIQGLEFFYGLQKPVDFARAAGSFCEVERNDPLLASQARLMAAHSLYQGKLLSPETFVCSAATSGYLKLLPEIVKFPLAERKKIIVNLIQAIQLEQDSQVLLRAIVKVFQFCGTTFQRDVKKLLLAEISKTDLIPRLAKNMDQATVDVLRNYANFISSSLADDKTYAEKAIAIYRKLNTVQDLMSALSLVKRDKGKFQEAFEILQLATQIALGEEKVSLEVIAEILREIRSCDSNYAGYVSTAAKSELNKMETSIFQLLLNPAIIENQPIEVAKFLWLNDTNKREEGKIAQLYTSYLHQPKDPSPLKKLALQGYAPAVEKLMKYYDGKKPKRAMVAGLFGKTSEHARRPLFFAFTYLLLTTDQAKSTQLYGSKLACLEAQEIIKKWANKQNATGAAAQYRVLANWMLLILDQVKNVVITDVFAFMLQKANANVDRLHYADLVEVLKKTLGVEWEWIGEKLSCEVKQTALVQKSEQPVKAVELEHKEAVPLYPNVAAAADAVQKELPAAKRVATVVTEEQLLNWFSSVPTVVSAAKSPAVALNEILSPEEFCLKAGEEKVDIKRPEHEDMLNVFFPLANEPYLATFFQPVEKPRDREVRSKQKESKQESIQEVRVAIVI